MSNLPKEAAMFKEYGITHKGLDEAQEFFNEYVQPKNGHDLLPAVLWLTEEVGELAKIVRTNNKGRFKDGVGDILMWLLTISSLLEVKTSESLEYSVTQLIAKEYSMLKTTAPIDPPLGHSDEKK